MATRQNISQDVRMSISNFTMRINLKYGFMVLINMNYTVAWFVLVLLLFMIGYLLYTDVER